MQVNLNGFLLIITNVYAMYFYVINGNVHHYSKLFIVDW